MVNHGSHPFDRTGYCDLACVNNCMAVDCDDSICDGTLGCKNRRVSSLIRPRVQVFKTNSKGFGLRAVHAIPKDVLIIVYTGEYMTKAHFYERRRETNTDGMGYAFQVTANVFLDAVHRGNHARFVNHSCAPNCVVRKRIADRLTRLCFVARTDIQPGEELTIDYNSAGSQDVFECRCDAGEQCRQIIQILCMFFFSFSCTTFGLHFQSKCKMEARAK